MIKRTRRRAARVVVALAACIAPVFVVPAASADELASSCQLYALTPFEDSGTLVGVGGRSGCVSTYRDVTVRIREDISFWPDRTVAEKTVQNALNVEITVAWEDCPFGDGGDFFVETLNGTGGKVQSQRFDFTCL
jgi:hypothetical protein